MTDLSTERVPTPSEAPDRETSEWGEVLQWDVLNGEILGAIVRCSCKGDAGCMICDGQGELHRQYELPGGEAIDLRQGMTSANWQDAAVSVDFRWRMFADAETPLAAAIALNLLANAMDDLRTFLPGYDLDSDSMPWQREMRLETSEDDDENDTGEEES